MDVETASGTRRGRTRQQRAEAQAEGIRLIGEGLPVKAVARAMTLSPRSVRRLMIAAGLPVGEQPPHLRRPALTGPATAEPAQAPLNEPDIRTVPDGHDSPD